MNTPVKKPSRSRVSADRPTAKSGKSSSEKKLLQRLHQKMKNTKAKKSAADRGEKKAIKKLLEAEKKFEKANINKIKAEAEVKRLADSRKLAVENFEAAKADYHARKESPVVTAKPATSN